MKHIIVGSNGFIGSALAHALRERGEAPECFCRPQFDLLRDPCTALPNDPDVVYLCAAAKGYANCDKFGSLSWQTNVDAQIAIARHYTLLPNFRVIEHPSHYLPILIVYISSDAVEFSSAAYAYQKRQVEAYMNTINAHIVRPGPVTAERVDEFAGLLIDIGTARKPGLTRWA